MLQPLRNTALLATLALATAAHAQTDSILVGGLERSYTVRLPGSYDGSTPLPLVVAMHGGFGSGLQLEQQSQLTAKGEAAGFIVVYPDGVPSPIGIRTWNAGWCCGYAADNAIDDVGFISALLDTLEAELAIDSLRIYATGMSNGGFLSYRLACELSERIAAIAPVAASMSMTACAPTRSMPVIAFHSYQDASVPYLGGIGTGVSAHYNPPLDSVQNAFAAHASCTVLNDTLLDDAEMTVISWHDCACAQEVVTYMTQDGGHSWPGGVQTPIGDPVSTVINADDLMWDFFQQYTLDCALPAATPERENALGLVLFPNPATDRITLTSSSYPLRMRIIAADGRVVLERVVRNAQASLDISALAPGTYVVQVLATDGSLQQARFVKRSENIEH